MTHLALIRSEREGWRARWLTVAESLRQTGKSEHAEEAKFIMTILAGEQEATDRDDATRRRHLLERTGSVEEVAAETGYTSSHLYALLRERKLVAANESGSSRLRFADVWRLKGVSLDVQDGIVDGLPVRPHHGQRSDVPQDRVVLRVVNSSSR